MLQLAAAYVDSVSRFVIPLCSMMPDRPEKSTPITSSLYLVDATNMGLKQAWSAKNLIQDISWLLSTCFPESIDKVLVRKLFALLGRSHLHRVLISNWIGMQFSFVLSDDLEILEALRRPIYSREDCLPAPIRSPAYAAGVYR